MCGMFFMQGLCYDLAHSPGGSTMLCQGPSGTGRTRLGPALRLLALEIEYKHPQGV